MRVKLIALFAFSALLITAVSLAAGDTNGRRTSKRQSNGLVALLPASDGVATFDAHRFLNAALPQLLAKSPSLLSKVTSTLTEIESKTGIDLRKFDSVVVGTTIVKAADAKTFTMDPVAIARGTMKADALLATAKTGSKGTVREEKYGTHTVYVFSTKAAVQKAGTGAHAAALGSTFSSLAQEVAVSTLDENTIAMGSLARVKATIDGTTHVSAEISSLLSAKESSVMTFAVKTPNGMSVFLPLENDELGNSVDSIQYVSGTVDVTTAGAALQVLAKTLKPEQAKSLYDTLDGLKMLGKAFLGSSKRADQQIYARLIENAKLAVKANVVSLDVTVPQADIDAMLATIK